MPEETQAPDPTTSVLAFVGEELRRMRTMAGMTQGDVARKALATQAMISYVETGKRIPSEDLAKGLDRTFSTDGFFARIHPLVLRHAYPTWFLPYVELERDAVSIRDWQTHLIPGLLQTEAYARAALSPLRPENLDDLVAARLSRQAIFERDTAPHAWFVMDEMALRPRLRNIAAMRQQYEHLIKAGNNPRTVIQVIPEKMSGPAAIGAYTILGFDEGPEVLHVDGFPQGRMGSDEGEVSIASHAYDLLRAAALPPEQSADLIGTYLKELTP